MVEIAGRLPDQADPLHHPPRPFVLWDRERHDLIQPDLLEAEPQRLTGCLGGIPVTPMLPRQPPADLHHRPVRHVIRRPQPHVADEGRHVHDLDRPEPQP
jgi:hypothetical protein